MKTENKLFNFILPFILSASISFYASKPGNSDYKFQNSSINNVSSFNDVGDVVNDAANDFYRFDDVDGSYNKVNNSALEEIIKNYNTNDLSNLVDYYTYISHGKYHDNMHYKIIRKLSAEKELSKYNIHSPNVLVIDKTFQKALIFTRNMIVDSSGTEKSVYTLTDEFDCSTAKIYGKKQRDGDGKTPEGLFLISSIDSSYNNLFNGKKAYGPYFMRIYHSIGIHGNGTDTVKVKNWRHDKTYMNPDPLGIADNNFGYGVSHGCGRIDNAKIRKKVEDGTFRKGTPVVIYEDKRITKLLEESYNNYDKEFFEQIYY